MDIAHVSIINEIEANGLRCFISHENIEPYDDEKMVINRTLAYAEIRSMKDDWEVVMKNALILQKLLRTEKKHKWRVLGIDKSEDQTDYVLRINCSILSPVG